jgi:iron complex transport system substrate-binding protein
VTAFNLETLERYPSRIACLTEETTETLYSLGEGDRLVGISGYTVRPPAARRKPKVSAFINAKIDKIVGLEPDIALTFSDLQADIARDLVRRGVTVLSFNQRSVEEILQMMLTLARLVGVPEKGVELVQTIQGQLETIRASAARFESRPRVFFEEWNNPLISGIRWVEELIEIAGGQPIFPELRNRPLAKDRIIDPGEVIGRNPEMIIGSWCGVRFNRDFVKSRDGWADIVAVGNDHVYEVKSTYILQPGPAALTERVRQLHWAFAHFFGMAVDPGIAPEEAVDPHLKTPPGAGTRDRQELS